ncbi:MAG: SOS response-associated peptidase [Aridibacter famidurans]|nr:SOS response-associated peptidase [Aridibacter famidurans]
MCGRYTCKSEIEEIADIIPGKFNYPEFSKSYNIAPSQPALIATFDEESGEYDGELAKWGLVPHWMKDPKKPFINARSETIFEKPSFKYLYKNHRCVAIADGFYEWAVIDDVKQPVYFYREDQKPFGFAGYWENDRESDGRTFVIMTADANDDVEPYHHRMPVMLTKPEIEAWLKEGNASVLKPFPYPLQSHIVSRAVNSPLNNSAELIVPYKEKE